MSETSGPGGRRAGQGRPSEYQAEGAKRKQADLRMQKALESLSDQQIEAFVNVLYEKAMGGDPASLRLMLEHLKGRAATQAPVQADTQIYVVAEGIPRGPAAAVAFRELREGVTGMANKTFVIQWIKKWTALGRG